MAERTVATTATPGTAAPVSAEETRMQEHYITPPVDIYETPEALVMLVDMAGVTADNLDVRVDNHVLTIRATAQHAAPAGAIYREYELANYFRQFQLNDKVDETTIGAELKHGVLTIQLSKAEEAKPRRITVQAG